MNLRRTLADLLADPGLRAAFARDPGGELAEAGFDDLDYGTAGEALLHYAQSAPLDVAEALGPVVRKWSPAAGDDAPDEGWELLADLTLDTDPVGDNTDPVGEDPAPVGEDPGEPAFGAGSDNHELSDADIDGPDPVGDSPDPVGQNPALHPEPLEVDVEAMIEPSDGQLIEPEPFEDYGMIDALDPEDLDLD